MSHLRGETQHLLHKLLGLGGLLQEQLHNGCEQLQLHLRDNHEKNMKRKVHKFSTVKGVGTYTSQDRKC